MQMIRGLQNDMSRMKNSFPSDRVTVSDPFPIEGTFEPEDEEDKR